MHVHKRSNKGQPYAESGIPIYWMINLANRQIEVHTDPEPNVNPPAYRNRRDDTHGDALSLTLDGAVVDNIFVAKLSV